MMQSKIVKLACSRSQNGVLLACDAENRISIMGGSSYRVQNTISHEGTLTDCCFMKTELKAATACTNN